MRYVVGGILIVLVAIIGIGFYQSWWKVQTVSTGDESRQTVDMSLTIDKDKAREDLDAASESTSKAIESAREGLEDLGKKAQEAVGSDTKSAAGIVVAMDEENRALEIDSDGETMRFHLAADVRVKDSAGSEQSLTLVKQGDHVTVTYKEDDDGKRATVVEHEPADAP